MIVDYSDLFGRINSFCFWNSVPFVYCFILKTFRLCRILRDRALYKVSSDFVDAALNGAIGVISRCIPPINPTDPECLHMSVLIFWLL